MLYFTDPALHDACALVLMSMVRNCPDTLNDHKSKVLPLVFLAMHETKDNGEYMLHLDLYFFGTMGLVLVDISFGAIQDFLTTFPIERKFTFVASDLVLEDLRACL